MTACSLLLRCLHNQRAYPNLRKGVMYAMRLWHMHLWQMPLLYRYMVFAQATAVSAVEAVTADSTLEECHYYPEFHLPSKVGKLYCRCTCLCTTCQLDQQIHLSSTGLLSFTTHTCTDELVHNRWTNHSSSRNGLQLTVCTGRQK